MKMKKKSIKRNENRIIKRPKFSNYKSSCPLADITMNIITRQV